MSTAFYPLGMISYGNRVPTAGYKSWKGKGIFSNPVGITSGTIRPLTNRDPLNSAPAPFGRPRPIKHYRKGIAIPVPVPIDNYDVSIDKYGDAVDYYYSNREVKSSKGGSLGGGNGGVGLITQMQGQPGGFIVKDNGQINNGINGLNEDCRTCKGVGIVSSWYPINNLTEKPEPNVTNPLLCCNQERKARKRVLPASTLTNRSYYTTNQQYLYNRCNTYTQKSFAYLTDVKDKPEYIGIDDPLLKEQAIRNAKPGGPVSYLFDYTANCNCNFRIEEAASETFFILFIDTLIYRGVVPESIKQNKSITNLHELADYIKTLDVASQKAAEALFLGLLNTNSNTNNAPFITGPGKDVRRGCARVFYKPNNPQFAKEGGVDSSTRTLKAKVTTIEKNFALLEGSRYTEFTKQKAARCEPAVYWMQGNPKANPKICFKNRDDINGSSQSVNPKYRPNYAIFNINSVTRNYT